MSYVTSFDGHPREPETFEFSQWTRGPDGRLIRVIKSHVAFDAAWPWWKRALVGLLSSALARISPPQVKEGGN